MLSAAILNQAYQNIKSVFESEGFIERCINAIEGDFALDFFESIAITFPKDDDYIIVLNILLKEMFRNGFNGRVEHQGDVEFYVNSMSYHFCVNHNGDVNSIRLGVIRKRENAVHYEYVYGQSPNGAGEGIQGSFVIPDFNSLPEVSQARVVSYYRGELTVYQYDTYFVLTVKPAEFVKDDIDNWELMLALLPIISDKVSITRNDEDADGARFTWVKEDRLIGSEPA